MTTAPDTGLRPPGEVPPAPARPTRKPLRPWDRIKFLLLLVVIRLILIWAAMADNPLLPFVDAVREQWPRYTWWYVLFGLELARQIHYLISERSAAYHHFWTNRLFGGFERVTHRRFSDWTRFRLARVIKWTVWIAIIALVAGAILKTSPLLALFQAPAIIWSILPFVVQMMFILFIAVGQFVAIFWFLSRGGIEVYYPDDIKTRFTDVWGQDHVLERVKENILYLEKPEAIESRGGYVPGGILLWGPPGTGKTLMAEAVAGETGRPYVFVDPGAFINMFFGVGVLKVKGLFRKLRKLALRYGGVIVFFDEADSLGNRGALAQGGGPGFPRGATPAPWATGGCHGFSYLSADSQWRLARDRSAPPAQPRGGSRARVVMGNMGMGGGGMGTLEALLTELSGLKKPRGFVNRYVRRLLGMRPKPPPKYRILVMMATNLPEALDQALLRPGRIDRIYKVGYPSKAGRIRTYRGYFDKVRHELTEDNLDKLATITPYATGATIKDTVNEALVTAIRDGREVITWADVIKAKQLKELGPPEDVEYIERERHAVAVHEACHAVVAYRTRLHMEIDIATIEKGSDYLGMVASIPPEDQFTRWRTEYEADILVSIASLAGERMFFAGDSSSGVSGDLESATQVASYMEGYWGMGATVSSYSTAKRLEVGGIGVPRKEREDETKVRTALADRIEDKLGDLLEQVTEILKANRREVLSLAHALETHKTLTGDDVVAVLERRRGPLVDGSVYDDPEFRDQLTAYHEAAVAAHRDHAPLTVPLPRPAGASDPVPFAVEPAALPPVPPVEAGELIGSDGPAIGGVGVSAGPDGQPVNGGETVSARTPSVPQQPRPAHSPWMRPVPNGAEPAGGDPPPDSAFPDGASPDGASSGRVPSASGPDGDTPAEVAPTSEEMPQTRAGSAAHRIAGAVRRLRDRLHRPA
ncbi:AAA family ATPase [Luedemannella helvata]|uniref:AAA+ ATPase domain-containing protein n=1 Tax=Luedemannella helvata TaxID=349315 RepID=A0ABN2KVD0_9ACTN